MSSPLDVLGDDEREALEKAAMPDFTAPMLATLTEDHFSDPDWIYERKLDGARLLAFCDGDQVRLRTRNDKDRNDSYPEIADALSAQKLPGLVIDGEVVAFNGKVTSFSRLQGRMQIDDPDQARATGIDIYFYAFDLLHCDGYDIAALPLRRRKAVLKAALDWEDPLRFTTHRNEEGLDFYEEACEKGWEGLIAKRADSAYVHARSRDWLKFKCVHQQEFVIGAFTDPQGERIGFGALLVGVYDGDELRYAGKVGTGYDDDTLERLHDRLAGIERKTPPFAEGEKIDEDGVHWVTPKLVCEVGFTEWTEAGKLRHPRYLGLRDDKPPEEVVRERPR